MRIRVHIAAGTVVAGKYQLESPLARGGMGSVWVARHVKLGSRLAVKFLDPRFASSPAFIERFEREARAAAALQSPNVVHVQDYGIDDDTPYLVMELLRGEDLGGRLSRVGRLSLPDAARIMVQVGKALRKAHEAGIVHRDLKPANLFLTQIDDEEVVKVLDFGIAKEAGSVGDATKTGEVMGSPHYMSPEQAKADKGVDHRADIWALGVILYRTVTGALPFPGDVLAAVLSKILIEPVPLVATVAPDLPPSLDPFFARAIAKSKEHRFQSVRELVDAFVQIAGGMPMSTSGTMAMGAPYGSPSSPGLSQSNPQLAYSNPQLAQSNPQLVQSNPQLAYSNPQLVQSNPHLAHSNPQLVQSNPQLAHSNPQLAQSGPLAGGPAATQLLSGTGPSTFAAANMAHDPSAKPRRSAVPFIVVGGLAVAILAGGAIGLSKLRGGAAASAEPDAKLQATPTSTAPAEPPKVDPAPSTPPAATPADPNAAATEAPSAAPSSSTTAKPAASDKKPASTKTPPKGTAKPGGGWGF